VSKGEIELGDVGGDVKDSNIAGRDIHIKNEAEAEFPEKRGCYLKAPGGIFLALIFSFILSLCAITLNNELQQLPPKIALLPTNTPTSTNTPAPTSTGKFSTNTPTPTLLSVGYFTPSPTPNLSIVTPKATSVLLPAPIILSPSDNGLEYLERVLLAWDWTNPPLQDNQYFFIEATFTGDNNGICKEGWLYWKWTKTTSFEVEAPTLLDVMCRSGGKVTWTVYVAEPTHRLPDGDLNFGFEHKQLGEKAIPRTFLLFKRGDINGDEDSHHDGPRID